MQQPYCERWPPKPTSEAEMLRMGETLFKRRIGLSTKRGFRLLNVSYADQQRVIVLIFYDFLFLLDDERTFGSWPAQARPKERLPSTWLWLAATSFRQINNLNSFGLYF